MMFFHDISISTGLLNPPTTALALAAIGAATTLSIVKAPKYPLISFCFLFFLLNHIIEGTIIPLELIFEHRNYLPSMLIFVPVAIAVVKALQYFAFSRIVRGMLAIAVVALLLVLGDTTSSRNDVFASRLSLLMDNAHKAPRLSRVHNNLGMYYWEHGQQDKALECFSRAAQLDRDVNIPQKAQAHFNLGLYSMAHTNRDDKAVDHFHQALGLNPRHTQARHFLELLEFKNLPPVMQEQRLPKLLADLPADGGYLYRFSVILLHTDRPNLAMRLARLADKHRPGFVQPLKIQALAWYMKGNTTKSRQM